MRHDPAIKRCLNKYGGDYRKAMISLSEEVSYHVYLLGGVLQRAYEDRAHVHDDYKDTCDGFVSWAQDVIINRNRRALYWYRSMYCKCRNWGISLSEAKTIPEKSFRFLPKYPDSSDKEKDKKYYLDLMRRMKSVEFERFMHQHNPDYYAHDDDTKKGKPKKCVAMSLNNEEEVQAWLDARERIRKYVGPHYWNNDSALLKQAVYYASEYLKSRKPPLRMAK